MGRMLRSKYGLKENGSATFSHKQRASQTCKGLQWASTLLCKGLRWEAVDGMRIQFWKDCWINEKPLIQVGDTDNDEDELVRDLWREGRGWDWPKLGDRLSNLNLLKLASVSLGNTEGESDTC